MSGDPQRSLSTISPDQFQNQTAMVMFADDTKCYRAVQCVEDGNSFQLDHDNTMKWCLDWRMDLNQTNVGFSTSEEAPSQ